MKTIGLIGGTSWVSTQDYYRIINQQINQRLGALNAGTILLYSVNYQDFVPNKDRWKEMEIKYGIIANKLQTAGAECILLCANTTHMIADKIQQQINIPLINIAEATANEITNQNLKTVALLGTKFTMEENFFKEKLTRQNIQTIIPASEDREFIHSTIFEELGKGIFIEATKKKYLQIIDGLKNKGAQGVIFGCTEIPMLIKPGECSIAVFDTMIIHATAAVDFALG